jgi:hypothetical protein
MVICCVGLLACGCGSLCSDTVKAEAKSPAGTYVATFYERDCGAATDWVQRINIRRSKKRFDGDDGVIFVGTRFPMLTMRWKDERNLEIVCDQCGSVQSEDRSSSLYKHEQTLGAVHISYQFSNRREIPSE